MRKLLLILMASCISMLAFAQALPIHGFGSTPTLWLRSDFGVDTLVGANTVNYWKDYLSADSADVGFAAPSYNSSNLFNFHSVVLFDNSVSGVSNPQSLKYSSPVYSKATSNGMDWFEVLRTRPAPAARLYPVVYDMGFCMSTNYAFYYSTTFNRTNALYVGFGAQGASAGTQPAMLSQEFQFNNSASNQRVYLNGGLSATARTSDLSAGFTASTITSYSPTSTGMTGPFMIGAQSNTNYMSLDKGAYYDGDIAEMIGFDSLLSATDQLNVQSYLAIKYGMTLATAIYSLSNDTVYNSALYTSCVAGLANDTASALDQKVSRSESASAIVTMSTTSDFVSSNEAASRATSLPIGSSIVWGNDGDPTTFMQNTLAVPAGYSRLNRTWEVQTTGAIPTMNIQVQINNPNFDISSRRDTTLYLLWDTQGNGIDVTDSIIRMTKDAGDTTFSVANLNLQNGQHFTFIRHAIIGLFKIPTLWLRSDFGVDTVAGGNSVHDWKDYLVSSDSADVGFAAPSYNSSDLFNFHSVVSFDNSVSGVSNPQSLKYSSPIFSKTGSGGMDWFEVLRTRPAPVNRLYPVVYDLGFCMGTNYAFYYSTTFNRTNAFYPGFGAQGASAGTQPAMLSQEFQFNNSASNQRVYLNGGLSAVKRTSDLSSGFNINTLTSYSSIPMGLTGPFMIGAQSNINNMPLDQGAYYDGDIAEMIGFDDLLSATDQLNVQSYLAIKYGITLATAIYSLSNDTVYNSALYTSCVAGLANDTASALDQKVSRSESASGIVTMSTTSDFVSSNEAASRANTSLAIGSSIVWGNDGDPDTIMQTALPVPAGYSRLSRTWEVQTKGTNAAVNIQVRINNPNFNLTSSDTTLALVWDTQGDGIGTNDSIIPMVKDAGDTTFSVANVNLQNGQHFTFARALPPPPLFKTPVLWLRSDKNVATDALGTTPAMNGDSVRFWKDYVNADTAQVIYSAPWYDTTDMQNFHAAIAFNRVTGTAPKNLSPQSLKYSRYVYSKPNSDGMNWFVVLKAKGQSNFTFTYNFGEYTNAVSRGYGMAYTTIIYQSYAMRKGWAPTVNQSAPTRAVLLGQTYEFSNNSPNSFLYRDEKLLGAGYTADLTLGFNSTTVNKAPLPSSNAGPFMIGCESGTKMLTLAPAYFLGDITEMIAFDGLLSPSDRLNVNSYLAIKYGITLDTTAIYSLSNDTVYNSTVYTSCIAGLANDTASALDQKVSHSVNDSAIVTMSTSSDFVSGNEVASRGGTSLPVGSSVVWGNDGGDTAYSTQAPLPAPAGYFRVGRKWEVQTQGAPSAVNIQVRTNNPSFYLTPSDPILDKNTLFLVWDTQGNGIDATDSIIPMVKDAGDTTFSVANVNLQNGQHFTFARALPPPPLFKTTALWLRSDFGVDTLVGANTVNYWKDYVSADSADVFFTAPSYNSGDLLNFHSVVSFNNNANGVAKPQSLRYSNPMFTKTGSDGMDWFEVLRPKKDPGVRTWPAFFNLGYCTGANYAFYYSTTYNRTNALSVNVGAQGASAGTQPAMLSQEFQFNNSASNQRVYLNGGLSGSGRNSDLSPGFNASNMAYSSTPMPNSGPFMIGCQSETNYMGSTYYYGDMAEMIAFDGLLSATDQLNVQSYLAIKYGITLDTAIYSLSNDTVYNSIVYTSCIAGLANDTASALDQKVSRSESASAIVTMSTTSDFVSSNEAAIRAISLPIGSSVVWGNDGDPNTLMQNTLAVPAGYSRLNRTWEVQTTGAIPTMNIQVRTNNPSFDISSRNDTMLYLLWDTQGNGIDATDSIIPMTKDAGDTTFSVANVNLQNGQHFTFIQHAVTGLSKTPVLWLRSDFGVDTVAVAGGNTVQVWKDYVRSDSADVGFAAPSYNSSDLLNFHSTVLFDNASNGMVKPQSLRYSNPMFTKTGSNGMDWFEVLRPKKDPGVRTWPAFFNLGFCTGANYAFYYSTTYNRTNALNTSVGAQGTSAGMQPAMLSQEFQFNNSTSNQRVYLNGGLSGSGRNSDLSSGFNASNMAYSPTPLLNSGPFMIGCQSNTKNMGSTYYYGDMAEMIGFEGLLSATDQLNVQSYLAIKYGITLATPIYSLSNDTVYTSVVYTSCIAGLAHDTAMALDQKVSRSESASGIVTMSTTSDFVSSNEAASRAISLPIGSSVVWGNDGDPNTLMQTVLPVPAGYSRLNRTWEVQTRGAVPLMNIQVRTNNPSFDISSRNDTMLYLLWDTQGNGIDATDSIIPMTKDAGDTTFSVANVNLQNGQHFTFIQHAVTGLSKTPVLWLRSDFGVDTVAVAGGNTVQVWKDYVRSDSADVGFAAPSYNSSDLLNFHSTVLFDNASNGMVKPQSLRYSNPMFTKTGSDGMDWFEVLRPKKDPGVRTWPAFFNLGFCTGANYAFYYSTTYNRTNALNTSVGAQGTSAGMQPAMLSQEFQFNNSTSNQRVYLNGGLSGSGRNSDLSSGFNASNMAYSPTPLLNSGPFMIGCQSNTKNMGSTYYYGDMAEMIGFEGLLSATDQLNVQSYLAIKYGITLATPIYSLSNDTVYTSVVYTSCIAGLAHDTAMALDQKVSRSESASGIVTMSTTSDFVSSNEAASRAISLPIGSSVVWGNDGDPNTLMQTVLPVPAGYSRLNRTWEVQTRGAVPLMNIQVQINNPSFNINDRYNTTLYFLWDTQGDGIGTNDSIIPMVKDAGDTTFSVPNVQLQHGQHFTLARAISPPPPLFKSPVLWLRSDFGVDTVVGANTVNYWKDYVYLDSADVGFAAPSYNSSNLFNFHSVVLFDNSVSGVSTPQSLKYSSPVFSRTGSDGMDWFEVLRTRPAPAARLYPVVYDMGLCWGNNYAFYYSTTVNSTNAIQASFGAQGTSAGTQPAMLSQEFQFNNSASNQRVYLNGGLSATARTSDLSSGFTASTITSYSPASMALTGPFMIGAQSNINYMTSDKGVYYDGDMAEMIGFDGLLSATDQLNVQSYLAIKYGITLDTAIYSLSNDTVYNSTVYTSCVAGLANDTASALDQKVSRSVNDSAIVTMSTSGDFVSSNEATSRAGTSLPIGSSIVWGNDGDPDTIMQTALPVPAGYSRLSRTWAVQTKGTNAAVNIQVRINNPVFNLTSSDTTLVLVWDTQGNGIDATDSIIPMVKDAGDTTFSVANVNLQNGQHFTFARALPPPPLYKSPVLWLRSDKNVASDAAGTVPAVNGGPVKYWKDYLHQDTASVIYQAPQYDTTNMYNFHAVVAFNNLANGLPKPQSLKYSSPIYSKVNSDGMDWFEVLRNKQETAKRNNPLVYCMGYYWYGSSYSLSYSSLSYLTTARHYKNWGASGTSAGTKAVMLFQRFRFDNNSPTQSIYLNGGFSGSGGTSDLSAGFASGTIAYTPIPTATSGPFMIGCASNTADLIANNGSYYYGDMAEMIAFDGLLPASDRLNVQSYLAIKYGITLDTAIYSLSNDTVYNSTVYTSCIAGLANDTASALDQKVSRSVNDSAIVTMSTSSDFVSSNEAASRAGTSLPVGSSVVWGNDGGDTTYSTQAPLPAPAGYFRVARKWEVQTQGALSAVNIQVRTNNPSFYLTPSDPTLDKSTLFLVWDTQGNGIDATDSIIPMVKDAGDTTFSVANVKLQNGQHFTFARIIAPPPPLYKSPVLWLRSDVGVDYSGSTHSVDSWKDFVTADSASRGEYVVTEPSTFAQFPAPTFRDTVSENYNFHPVIHFDNSNPIDYTHFQNLKYSSFVFTGAGSNGMTWFSVVRPEADAKARTQAFVYDFGYAANYISNDTYTGGYGMCYDYNNLAAYTPKSGNNTTHNRKGQPTLLTQNIDFGSQKQNIYADGSSLSPVIFVGCC